MMTEQACRAQGGCRRSFLRWTPSAHPAGCDLASSQGGTAKAWTWDTAAGKDSRGRGDPQSTPQQQLGPRCPVVVGGHPLRRPPAPPALHLPCSPTTVLTSRLQRARARSTPGKWRGNDFEVCKTWRLPVGLTWSHLRCTVVTRVPSPELRAQRALVWETILCRFSLDPFLPTV